MGCGVITPHWADGFTFEFFRKYWTVVGPDFCIVVKWFFDHGDFAIGCNSLFVALIPKVLDPKVVSDYHPIRLIEAFTKSLLKSLSFSAFLWLFSESLSQMFNCILPNNRFSDGWDYLDDVLISFGFGPKWRSWIRGSLSSGKASILVNGSPTSEFHLYRGWEFLVVFALIGALFSKWVWRYLSHDNSLWFRIISALHGLNGHVLSAAFNSTWSSIITEVNSLKVKGGRSLFSHCKICEGKGQVHKLLKGSLIGDNHHKLSFPLLFLLEENKTYRWDFIDDILSRFGFGEKWRMWIQGCFSSCMGSVLVNGSPTKEFQFHRGLRQGDPLSPFLFLLVMESLHIAFMNIMEKSLFSPLVIRNGMKINLSHLFYADDAIFIGRWSSANIVSLVRLLQCFHLTSGMKVNFHKTTLVGVQVPIEEVEYMASYIGCKVSKSLGSYLGVKVGVNMSRIDSWKEVIDKVNNKLSKWKVKTLSVGGRLTLLKSVLGVIPTYYMSIYKAPKAVVNYLESIRNKFFIGADMDERKTTWVSWKKVLVSHREGGLGVNSIFALNHALLFKWIWRFMVYPNALWVKVVKAIHDEGGGINATTRKVYPSSVWINVLKAMDSIKEHENGILKDIFPRVYALELDKSITVSAKKVQGTGTDSLRRHPRGGVESVQWSQVQSLVTDIHLATIEDRWFWTLE
ncbi:RNA-directed DNA polymerase, eukaryota, reverse transcriptase zinc-binding domain protein, partial [Tanacetum coccineum]